jgi:hypothetical protein
MQLAPIKLKLGILGKATHHNLIFRVLLLEHDNFLWTENLCTCLGTHSLITKQIETIHNQEIYQVLLVDISRSLNCLCDIQLSSWFKLLKVFEVIYNRKSTIRLDI